MDIPTTAKLRSVLNMNSYLHRNKTCTNTGAYKTNVDSDLLVVFNPPKVRGKT